MERARAAGAAATAAAATAAAATTAGTASVRPREGMAVRRAEGARARAAGEMAAAAGEMAAEVKRVEVAGKVTVRRCTGLQERRAGTYSPEDYGGAIAPPIERVRMSLRTG
jgi:hypothetical protein